MRLNSIVVAVAIAGAALLALVVANAGVSLVEDRAETEVRAALDKEGMTWVRAEGSGLTVQLSGTAPDEATRFHALSVAGTVIDASRVLDEMETQAAADLAAPRFSIEMLRNTSGLSLIGLVPASTDRTQLVASLTERTDQPIADLLETADYAAPSGWQDALAFALLAVETLPRSKISVDAGRVEVMAIAASVEEKNALDRRLQDAAPPALQVMLNIDAPRPVITPFTIRFILDENGARFDACAADTEAARDRIMEAARSAGLTGSARCTIGMGVPSNEWATAASASISALGALGGGSLTLSDADISLVAAQGVAPRLFDKVVGELEEALPEVFALQAVLPEPEEAEKGPAEFIATLSPEGQVQLRGRLATEQMRTVADSFARARFGSENVYTAARITSELPQDWGKRVLAGIEALSHLENGALIVTPAELTLSGRSNSEDARDVVSRLITGKLGAAADFAIDIAYVPAPDPGDLVPTPEQCERELGAIVSVAKINFEPGSATIDAEAVGTMDDIAEVLNACGDLRLEVQGYTDSQGREEMNLALSQSRAESVLNELRARKVLTANFTAKGYGEANPIADNGTEEGREANRRIEFKLIKPEPLGTEQKTTLETIAENSDIEGAEPDASSSEQAE